MRTINSPDFFVDRITKSAESPRRIIMERLFFSSSLFVVAINYFTAGGS